MLYKSAVVSIALLIPVVGVSQTPAVSGAFVSTLGVDTVAVERYTRVGDKLEGDVLLRYPRVRVVHYVADVPSGKLKGISVTTRRPDLDPAAPPLFTMSTVIVDSVATVAVERGGRPDTTVSGRHTFKGIAVPSFPGIPGSFAMYEQILAMNPLKAADTVRLSAIESASNARTISLYRAGRDTIAYTNSIAPGWVEYITVDGTGHLTSVDSRATTIKTTTKRQPSIDFDALIKSWAAAEVARGVAGSLSPADTVRAKIGTANVEVAYSRPSKRGRVIFGSVVPFNQVWRTGANAATQFTTPVDLMFGNTVIPAGKYTLWSLPTASGAKLIVNTQTGQWGTEYDPKKDLARLDMTVTTLSKPVDEFTFAIAPQGNAGVLKFSWDDREYSIPFRVK